MICKRPAHKARGSLWEFVAARSSRASQSKRSVSAGRSCDHRCAGASFMEVTHVYPDMSIHLTLSARITAGRSFWSMRRCAGSHREMPELNSALRTRRFHPPARGGQ
ncbi:MAG: hypothetical protein ACLVB4_04130 [Butyricicoccus sp.]